MKKTISFNAYPRYIPFPIQISYSLDRPKKEESSLEERVSDKPIFISDEFPEVSLKEFFKKCDVNFLYIKKVLPYLISTFNY